MADFRVVISSPKDGKAYQVEISGAEANKFIGKSISDTIEGDVVGLRGYTLRITGGTDKDGFPMRKDLPKGQRRKILMYAGTGHHPKEKGQRRRKTVCGREITANICQINATITKYGPKSVADLLGSKKEKEE